MISIMKKLLILIGLFIFASGCTTQIRPLQTWDIDQEIYSASFSKNKLALLAKDSVKVIDLFGNRESEKDFNIPNSVNNKIFCEDNECWIGGGNKADGAIFNLDIINGTLRPLNQDKYAEVYAILPLRDKNILVTGHANGEINLWDLNTGIKELSFGDYDAEVFAIESSADDGKVYSGNGIGSVMLWDLSSGKKVNSGIKAENSIFALDFSEQAKRVIGGGSSGVCYILSNNLSVQSKIIFNGESILSCNSHPNFGKVLCGLTSGYVATANYDGAEKSSYRLHYTDVIFVEHLDNGEKIITVSKDGVIRLWEAQLF